MPMQFVSRVDVGNMHLDDRSFEDLERVEHRDGRERVCRWVDYDRIGLLPRRLNEIDQGPLMIRLMKRQMGAGGIRKLLTARLDGGKRGRAVYVRLAHAQKVEIRTVQNHQARRHRLLPLNVGSWVVFRDS